VARKTDVRIIAATNRNLRKLASEGAFREDLYYRLCMIEIKLPSVAERPEDLPLLERYFLERFAREYGKPIQRLARRAEAVMARYPWPGNVRELENALGHACMMTDGDVINVADLPEYLRNQAPCALPEQLELVTMAVVERRHAARVLAALNGNKLQAARILGIHRTTLARMLQEDFAAAEVEEDELALSRPHRSA
jgi:DNA-binding NtrC family response regulator